MKLEYKENIAVRVKITSHGPLRSTAELKVKKKIKLKT